MMRRLSTATCFISVVLLLHTANAFGPSSVPKSARAATCSRLFQSASSAFAVATAVPEAWDVRSAGDSDIDLVESFFNKIRAFTRDITSEHEPSPFKPPVAGATLVSLFPEQPTAKVLLIEGENDDGPIGFAMYKLQYSCLDAPPTLWLDRIFVDPAERSRGAGRALMNSVVDIGTSNSCNSMSWVVNVENDRALAFYDRIGAEVTGRSSGTHYDVSWVPKEWKQ